MKRSRYILTSLPDTRGRDEKSHSVNVCRGGGRGIDREIDKWVDKRQTKRERETGRDTSKLDRDRYRQTHPHRNT